MKRNDSNTNDSTAPYLAILNKKGDAIVAFVNPAKNVSLEDLETALKGKGVNAEIRVPDTESKTVEL